MSATDLSALALCLGVISGGVYLCKNSQIWSAEISGKARLAEAEFGSKARSKAEAAKLEGEAELTRAQFSAKANSELAEGLGGSEGRQDGDLRSHRGEPSGELRFFTDAALGYDGSKLHSWIET